MFERFTVQARRVIFFARYEAANYGSRTIETEHLLLGLLRENPEFAQWFPGEPHYRQNIRAEVESQITRGNPILESVEVPVSAECKKVLGFAGETSERLGQREIEPVHMLIGLLGTQGSRAAQILTARGLKQQPILEHLASATQAQNQENVATVAATTLDRFLASLKGLNTPELFSFFAQNAEFIDASGNRWNRHETLKQFATLFAPYAKKNASYMIEDTAAHSRDLFIATVFWKNAILASEQRCWAHRMSLVLILVAGRWEILLAQVTPLQLVGDQSISR